MLLNKIAIERKLIHRCNILKKDIIPKTKIDLTFADHKKLATLMQLLSVINRKAKSSKKDKIDALKKKRSSLIKRRASLLFQIYLPKYR